MYRIYVTYAGTAIPVSANGDLNVTGGPVSAVRSFCTGSGLGTMQVGDMQRPAVGAADAGCCPQPVTACDYTRTLGHACSMSAPRSGA